MAYDPTPEVTVQDAPRVDHDVATAHRKKASATVARADVDNLRDDPEAKAAFLSTFTAAEEKKIMRKVDKCFILLTGIMYLIKQVCLPYFQASNPLTGWYVDRREQCSEYQSPARRPAFQYTAGAQDVI
jgi:hypothetical protein